MGDVLYYAAVALQLVAFHQGMRPITLGIGLTVYGLGLTFYTYYWRAG